jgi:hypothetical protein
LLSSLASDDREKDGRRHHPAGVGIAADRVKEATVLGPGGRLKRLAAIVGGEYARDDSG